MSKIAVGVVFVGKEKDYIFNKFLEMAETCIRPLGVDIIWATDRQTICDDKILGMSCNSSYVEDICMIGRELLREYAYNNNYDKLVWQGIDCLYNTKDDFEKLLSTNLDAVGGLTTARSNSKQAVAANFVRDINGVTEEHTQFSSWALDHGWTIEADIPGTDALVFNKNCLDISWVGKHTPWYERSKMGLPDLTCEGWYLLELVKRGQKIHLDTSVKTWHVHEDGIARRWYGEEKSLNELSW